MPQALSVAQQLLALQALQQAKFDQPLQVQPTPVGPMREKKIKTGI